MAFFSAIFSPLRCHPVAILSAISHSLSSLRHSPHHSLLSSLSHLLTQVLKGIKLLICGEDLIETDSTDLQFSFETHKQMIRIARRLLCGKAE